MALQTAPRFRDRLIAGQSLLGTFIKSPGVHAIEVLGEVGLDFVVIDAEHAPWDRSDIDSAVLAAKSQSLPALVRVQSTADILTALDCGAAGVMVAPAPSVRSDEQIVSYFDMVSETLGPDVPWVLQDHPVATGVQMPTSVILRIIERAANCVMLKHEDCPGLAKLSAIRAASARGDVRRVSILTGNGGGLFLPEELARGADGAMTGFAYPEMMVEVCRAFAAGDRDRAQDIFDAYLPLARYEQQAGIGLAVRKHILTERGVIASAAIRKPGPKLSAADIADITWLTTRQQRRLAEIG